MIREQEEPRERRCPACGQGALVARVIRDEFEYGPEEDRITIVAEGVPVLECPACGETLYGPDAARVRHQAICRTLGLLTPEQIKGVREKLGKKQAEFAALTGIGVATLSRWEQGRLIQTRALDRYLRLLQWEENIQRLGELQEGPNGMSPTPASGSPCLDGRSLTMTDEQITDCVKAFIMHGLPMNTALDVSRVSLGHALRIDVRLHSLPTEINLGPLLLQISPPEYQEQYPAVSRQFLKELNDKKEAEVTGNFGDIRPITVRFTVG